MAAWQAAQTHHRKGTADGWQLSTALTIIIRETFSAPHDASCEELPLLLEPILEPCLILELYPEMLVYRAKILLAFQSLFCFSTIGINLNPRDYLGTVGHII